MEKRVILLTDYYLPNNNANGLCMHRIGKAMQREGYEVHIVCYLEKNLKAEDMIEGMYVHRVRPQYFFAMRDYYYKHSDSISGKLCWMLALLSRRVKKVLLMPWYPLVSPSTVRRYCNKIKEIACEHQVKNVVAGFNPFESAAASVWLKKHGEYSVITYFMDTFTVTANAKNSKIIYNRGRAWEKKIYGCVDGIANFPTYREHFSSDDYEAYQDKMMYVGVPIDFDELSNTHGAYGEFKDGITHLLYTGGLSMGDREPVYLIELLQKSGMKQVEMHFFSRGNAEDYLKEKQESCKMIRAHGQVPYDELLSARSSADVMINIGSQKETILPSRLFEYIATGRPILHIAYRKDDPCIYYLEKHPDALILYTDDDKTENIRKMMEFIGKSRRKVIPVEELKRIYAENSAENIAVKFDKVFHKE